VVPPEQTCCGQPALNSGDRATAIDLAKRVIAMLEPYDACGHPVWLLRRNDPLSLSRDIGRRS
jgi:Fe-S oxidoreductase